MKRILIKLSGEGLSNKEKKLDIDPEIIQKIAIQIKKLINKKMEIGIVIGGGNFWRGASAEKNGICRNRADYIGMLATVMNGLAIQSAFETLDIKTKVQSALNMDPKVAESYVNEKTLKAFSKNQVVIFVGGIGRPFFTTDTAAILIASEIKADFILMGKNQVDGVYDSDPKINKNAKRFSTISWTKVLEKKLKVMDSTAASLARNNNIKVLVFNINAENSIIKVIEDKINYTKVEN